MNYSPFRDGGERERFRELVNENGPVPPLHPELGPCHLWTGPVVPRHGYGMFFRLDRRVHRMVLAEALGRMLGRWEFACHRCDVKLCVRLSHLFLGSPAANSSDMVAKGRQARPWLGKRMAFSEGLANIRAAARVGRPHKPETVAKIQAKASDSVRKGWETRRRNGNAGWSASRRAKANRG